MGVRRAILAAAALLLVSGGGPRAGARLEAVLVADGAAGTWLAWCETGDTGAVSAVRLTRLDATGAPASGWSAQGIRVSASPDAQREPALASDYAGGVWIAWSDRRSGPRRVHVARVARDGTVLVSDRRIGASGREDFRPALSTTHGGGVRVAWESWDGRSSDVRLQLLEADGAIARGWPAHGLAVADSPFEECAPHWLERSGEPALAFTAYDGPDPRRGQLQAATLAPREPRVVWRGPAVPPGARR